MLADLLPDGLTTLRELREKSLDPFQSRLEIIAGGLFPVGSGKRRRMHSVGNGYFITSYYLGLIPYFFFDFRINIKIDHLFLSTFLGV